MPDADACRSTCMSSASIRRSGFLPTCTLKNHFADHHPNGSSVLFLPRDPSAVLQSLHLATSLSPTRAVCLFSSCRPCPYSPWHSLLPHDSRRARLLRCKGIISSHSSVPLIRLISIPAASLVFILHLCSVNYGKHKVREAKGD